MPLRERMVLPRKLLKVATRQKARKRRSRSRSARPGHAAPLGRNPLASSPRPHFSLRICRSRSMTTVSPRSSRMRNLRLLRLGLFVGAMVVLARARDTVSFLLRTRPSSRRHWNRSRAQKFRMVRKACARSPSRSLLTHSTATTRLLERKTCRLSRLRSCSYITNSCSNVCHHSAPSPSHLLIVSFRHVCSRSWVVLRLLRFIRVSLVRTEANIHFLCPIMY